MVFEAIRQLMAPPEPNKRKIWVSGEGTSSALREKVDRSFSRFRNCETVEVLVGAVILTFWEFQRNVVRTVLVFRARSLGGNRNEKRTGSRRIQAGASVGR